jgi:hypothetical protein
VHRGGVKIPAWLSCPGQLHPTSLNSIFIIFTMDVPIAANILGTIGAVSTVN